MDRRTRWLTAALLLGLVTGLGLLLSTHDYAASVAAEPAAPVVGPRSAPDGGGAPAEPAASTAPASNESQRVPVAADQERHFAVRVRTSFGTPAAGWPVRFLIRPKRIGSGQELRVRDTGVDGCAALTSEELPRALWAQELCAEVVCVGASASTPWLVARTWPFEPMDLGLPPLVTVRVAVVDPDGLPAREAGRVRLDCLRGGERFASVNEQYAGGEATACFPRVPADAALEARAVQGAVEWALERLAGPFVAGTEVHVTLRRTESVAILAGRLADAAGELLRRQVFKCSLFPREGATADVEARTGDQGEFRLAVPHGWLGQPLDRLLFSVGMKAGPFDMDWPEPGERLARLVAEDRIEPRLQDLGVVRLRGLEVLAGGEVVDEAGNPIQGAGLPFALDLGADRDRLDRVLLRAHGVGHHFSVFGHELPAGAQVTMGFGPFRAKAPLPLRAGAHDHRLVLVRGGEVVLTAIIEPGQEPRLWLEPAGTGLLFNPSNTITAHTTLSASWNQLRAGLHTLRIQRDPSGAFEVVLPDVLIEDGPRCNDPRLRSLDLRSRPAK